MMRSGGIGHVVEYGGENPRGITAGAASGVCG